MDFGLNDIDQLIEESLENDVYQKQLQEELEHDLPPEYKTKCINCPSTSINEAWKEKFNIQICNKCKYGDPDFDLITKTSTKTDFLLTERDLINFGCFKKRKDHKQYNRTITLKLYLKSQIQEFSHKKYGGEEGLKEAKKQKEVNALERSLKKLERKRQTNEEFLAPPKKKLKLKEHVHEFGPEKCENGMNFKVCTLCKFKEEWEDF